MPLFLLPTEKSGFFKEFWLMAEDYCIFLSGNNSLRYFFY